MTKTKKKRGRPPGRKEALKIRVSDKHKFYLWAQRSSYSKIMANLMEDAIKGK